MLITYLGEEGAVFTRQIAAGFRYSANGSGPSLGRLMPHDTSLALSKVLDQYRSNPDSFNNYDTRSMMQNVMAMVDSINQPLALSRQFNLSVASALDSTPQAAFENAKAREQWAVAAAEAGKHPELRTYYEKFIKPGDALMLTLEGLSENLQRLIGLSPLDPLAPAGPDTKDRIAACQASRTTANKPMQ